MAHKQLITFLSQLHAVEPEVLETYASCWSEMQVPRREIMTGAGDTERYMHFVLDGIQKSYYLQDAKQHVIAFTYPPSFSGIPESFPDSSAPAARSDFTSF